MASLEINGYSVDEISKAFGALAVGAYVAGYLILSYHLSNFGFNPVSPFRPRVLETGVCALLFFAIPILIAETLTAIPSRGLSSMTMFILRALSLPIICDFSISLPGFLDDLPKSSPIHLDLHGTALNKALIIGGAIALISILVFAAALIRWMWRSYHKKQVACICVLIALDILFVGSEFTSMNSPVTKRTFLWFLLISFVSLGLIGESRDSVAKKKQRDQIEECQLQIKKSTKIIKFIELEIDPLTAGTYKFVEPSADYDLEEMLSQAKTGRLQLENDLAQFRSDVSIWQLRDFFTKHNFLLSFSYIMLAIAAFSNWVFPLIPLKVGGGEILPITVYISKADSLSGTVHGGLLDESDQGYFLLPSGQAKGIFIPKERVEAIYFTNGPSDLHELTK